MMDQAVEIAVAGYDNCLLIILIFDHGLEDELGITIPFCMAVFVFQCRFEYTNETCLLKRYIQISIALNIADKKKCLSHSILLFQIHAEPSEIQLPAERLNTEVQILAVYKSIVTRVFIPPS